MGSMLASLGLTPYEFIWTIVDFLIILFILYKFFYHPVMNFLDKRSEGIANNVSDAEKAKKEADTILQEYRAKLADANKEAMAIRERATKSGEEERQNIIAQGHAESAALVEKARQEIRRERDEALQSLRQEVGNIAVMAAEKILKRAVTEADHQGAVEEFIDEVGDVN